MPRARSFADSETPSGVLEELRTLLDAAFEGSFSDDDWQHTRGGWRVVAFDGDRPVAHAAVVPRVLWVGEHAFKAGYVEGVGTLPRRQRAGLGSKVMTQASEIVRRRFDLGALSTSRHSFYTRLGWERWRGPSFVRRDELLERTADEDDGLMVLRCGPSDGIDLTARIVCEARSGDDW